MPISDRNYDARLSYGSKVNPLIVLIGIAMIVFVVLTFFMAITYLRLREGSDVTAYFNKNILSWFALSADNGKLLTRPWTILSYSFAHTGVWQLIANLLWLWSFGYIFVDLTGYRKIVPVYVYGALIGGIAFLITANIMPHHSTEYFVGAGAAIMAICAAATTISPTYKVFPMLGGGISLWIISAIYLIINVATLPASNPVLYIAYLAGALAGFLFIFLLRRGLDGSDWMNNLYDWFINLFNPEKPNQKRQALKSTLFYNAQKTPYTKTPKLTQKKLDEILDKINQFGYDKLSQDEKDFLARVSKEDLRDK